MANIELPDERLDLIDGDQATRNAHHMTAGWSIEEREYVFIRIPEVEIEAKFPDWHRDIQWRSRVSIPHARSRRTSSR